VATRPIRRFGDPVLRQKAARITSFDYNLRAIVSDLRETLAEAGGVGLAAPQVGLSMRLLIIDIQDQGSYVLVNPEIVKRTGKRVVTEGCLSFPGWFGEVERSERVSVRAKDEFGKDVRIAADDLLAQAIEHEVDHLNGILFTDRLIAPDRLWKQERDEPSRESSASAAA
jgi:peptide deformylase